MNLTLKLLIYCTVFKHLSYSKICVLCLHLQIIKQLKISNNTLHLDLILKKKSLELTNQGYTCLEIERSLVA